MNHSESFHSLNIVQKWGEGRSVKIFASHSGKEGVSRYLPLSFSNVTAKPFRSPLKAV